MLITTIEELDELTGIGLGNSYERYRVHLQQAEHDQLKPILGDTLYDRLVADYDADAITTEPDTRLLALSQAVVGNFGLAESLDRGQVHISDQGIHKNEDSAYHYQKVEAQNSFFRAGYRAVEQLLQFLEKHADTYTDWKESDNYAEQRSYLIPSATEFQKHYNIMGSRRTYLALRPYMRRVEQFQLEPILGSERYAELQQTVQDDANLTAEAKADNETLLDTYVRPALAYLSLSQAIPELSLNISAQGIHLSEEQAVSDKASSREQATEQQQLRLSERLADTADQHLQRLKAFLAPDTAVSDEETILPSKPSKRIYGM